MPDKKEGHHGGGSSDSVGLGRTNPERKSQGKRAVRVGMHNSLINPERDMVLDDGKSEEEARKTQRSCVFKKIAGHAIELWDSFVISRQKSNTWRPERLFDRGRHGRTENAGVGSPTVDQKSRSTKPSRAKWYNSIALKFYKYCAQLHGFEDAKLLQVPLPEDMAPGVDGRAASWLWSDHGEPLVFIDQPYVEEEAVTDMETQPGGCMGCENAVTMQVNRASSRMLLHETGHMVLHWDHLNPVTDSSKEHRLPLDAAGGEFEEQAWWFAMDIVGLALGAYGRRMREGQNHDDAWRHA